MMKSDMNDPYGAPPPYPGEGNAPTGQPYMPPQDYGHQPQQPPMPGYGYPTAQPMQAPPTVITSATPVVMVGVLPFGDQSMQTTCGRCGASVFTETKTSPGGLAWLVFALCCIFGCWFGCCLIPFCVDSMQDVHHYCPNCKARLGSYNRL